MASGSGGAVGTLAGAHRPVSVTQWSVDDIAGFVSSWARLLSIYGDCLAYFYLCYNFGSLLTA